MAAGFGSTTGGPGQHTQQTVARAGAGAGAVVAVPVTPVRRRYFRPSAAAAARAPR